ADWDREGFTPEGPGPYRQFMAIRVFDCWYHDQDIREALDEPGYLDGPVADLTLGRIPPKGLPYVVGKKAAAPPGSTVVFEVDGWPPLVAAVRVPPEGRAVVLDSAPPDEARRNGRARLLAARLGGYQAAAHRDLRLRRQAGVHGLGRGSLARQPDEGLLLAAPSARPRGGGRRGRARARSRGPRDRR